MLYFGGNIKMKKILIPMFTFILAFAVLANAQILTTSPNTVFINEVSNSASQSNFVEIYYSGAGTLGIQSWTLEKDGQAPFLLTGYILDSILRFRTIDESQLGYDLGASGTLKLKNGQGQEMNVFVYSNIPANYSEGRFPDGSLSIAVGTPTPGTANNNNGPTSTGFGDKLKITDVEINGDDFSEGDKYDESKPGDRLEFDITVENLFDRSGLEIENVQVEVVIQDIDDGDDLDEDTEEIDIDPDEDRDFEVDFIVPYEIEHGEEYDIIITAEGTDESGTIHRNVLKGTIEIEKDRHSVKITKATLIPDSVSCSRQFNVDLEITNLGRDDEDDAALSIAGASLGINKRFEFSLDKDPSDSDYDIDQSFAFSLDSSVDEGAYNIEVKTYYDKTAQSDSQTLTLNVLECDAKPVSQSKPENKNPVTVTFGGQIPQETESKEGLNELNELSEQKTAIILSILIILALILGFYAIRKMRS